MLNQKNYFIFVQLGIIYIKKQTHNIKKKNYSIEQINQINFLESTNFRNSNIWKYKNKP